MNVAIECTRYMCHTLKTVLHRFSHEQILVQRILLCAFIPANVVVSHMKVMPYLQYRSYEVSYSMHVCSLSAEFWFLKLLNIRTQSYDIVRILYTYSPTLPCLTLPCLTLPTYLYLPPYLSACLPIYLPTYLYRQTDRQACIHACSHM